MIFCSKVIEVLAGIDDLIPRNLQSLQVSASHFNKSFFAWDQQVIFHEHEKREKKFVQKVDSLKKVLINDKMLNSSKSTM